MAFELGGVRVSLLDVSSIGAASPIGPALLARPTDAKLAPCAGLPGRALPRP